ncbi:MAG: hypothetical protein KC441_04905 [Anaerolineales bacterium]|nr:hypothetical protein [Anaerolineales bacterium]
MTRTALAEPNVLPNTQFILLPETADQLRDHALEQARHKMQLPLRQAELKDLLLRADFVEYFKFNLAHGLAQTLAGVDEQVQAVHYFDPNLNPDAQTETAVPLDPTINLLVEVQAPSPALKSFVAALDGYLTDAVRVLPTPLFVSLHSLTNVMLVTAEDVARRRGFALILDSIYTPTRRLWPQ